MSFAHELVEHAAPLWQKYMAHPFIQGMIDGTLPRENFAWYLMQDSQYLKDYAKVYATAFIKTDDVELMRDIYRDMSLIVTDESMMHIRYLKDMGYTEADAFAAPCAAENREYLDFMLKTAAEGTEAEGLVSVMPCAFSYRDIGIYCYEQATARGTLEGNYYADWIRDYAGENYQGIFNHAVKVCDYVTKDLDDAQKARLKQIFYRSSEYELGFWDMAMRGPNA